MLIVDLLSVHLTAVYEIEETKAQEMCTTCLHGISLIFAVTRQMSLEVYRIRSLPPREVCTPHYP
jgi:uncharacterized membrane protein YqjE